MNTSQKLKAFTDVYVSRLNAFIFFLVRLFFCFLGQKRIPPASPPESPQGPGVRHLLTYWILQVTYNIGQPRKLLSKVPS